MNENEVDRDPVGPPDSAPWRFVILAGALVAATSAWRWTREGFDVATALLLAGGVLVALLAARRLRSSAHARVISAGPASRVRARPRP